MKSYWEMLRSPRWQRKRLEVMERAGFACEECGDKETTLNVHHTFYEKGRKPWEYESEDLLCLCAPCHEVVTAHMAEMQRIVGRSRRHEREMMLGFARVRSWEHERVLIESPSVAAGVSMAAGGISVERVMAHVDEMSTVDVSSLFIDYLASLPNRPKCELPMEYEPEPVRGAFADWEPVDG